MAKKKKEKKEEAVDLIACEKELRKYVRRDGGYCKGVTGNEQKRAQELLKLLGRKGLTWDDSVISVPQRNIMV